MRIAEPEIYIAQMQPDNPFPAMSAFSAFPGEAEAFSTKAIGAVECTPTITRSLQLFVQLIACRPPDWPLIGHSLDSTRYPRPHCKPHALR
jgi:hypothetical protein